MSGSTCGCVLRFFGERSNRKARLLEQIRQAGFSGANILYPILGSKVVSLKKAPPS